MTFNFIYIVNNFPPAGMQSGIRALEISKRLVKENINPIILTKNVIDKTKNFNNSLIREIPQSLEIYRTPFLKLRNYLYYIEPFFKFEVYLEWIPYAFFCDWGYPRY